MSLTDKVSQMAKKREQLYADYVAGVVDGSTSNADWWIRDFYDTAGGRQRDRASGTGGSNASAGMVHIK